MLLIDATMTAISTHGFSNLTLTKIAGLVGLTAGTVNFHFLTKEALLLSTLKHVAEEFEMTVARAIAEADADPARQLAAIVEASLDDEVTEFKKVAVWYAFMSEASGREDYRSICGDRERNYALSILNACEAIISSAGKQRKLNAKAISQAICGLINEIWQEILFEGSGYDRDQARQQCFAFLASIFPWCFSMPVPTEVLCEDNLQENLTYTLPSWVYHNSDFFELEKENVFLSSWQLVCHTGDIRNPGSYVTFELFNERAFAIRTDSGAIRAFHNVCRHRAHIILGDEEGQCRNKLVCPYHGWTYNLNGERIAIGFPSSFREHDPAQFGLIPIDCEIYLGFVFIRFRSEGPAVAARMAPLENEFKAYATENMSNLDSSNGFWSRTVNVNWKNAVENFLEDYHFFMGHKGLSALMSDEYDREPFETDVARLSHKMRDKPGANWSVERYHQMLPDQAHLPETMRRRWTYYALYPNTFFDLYPDKMDFFQILPVAPGRSVLRGRSYGLASGDRLMKAVRYLNDRINARVQHEDNRLTEAVQHGIVSSSYQGGILSDKEILVKQFGDYLKEKIPEATSMTKPTSPVFATTGQGGNRR